MQHPDPGTNGDDDPADRFTGRVDHYSAHRPGYPHRLVMVLKENGILAPSALVADIGSGTGLLTELFLREGHVTYAVEPNAEMRREAESRLSAYPHFRSVDGRAEATGLRSGSIDLIVVGQAFHWFEPVATKAEWTRILASDRSNVAIIWNDRLEAAGFDRSYEELVHRLGLVGARHRSSLTTYDDMLHFFGHRDILYAELHHDQKLDRKGVIGRFLSASYAPRPDDVGYDEAVQALNGLFDEKNRDGTVTMSYRTVLYCGYLI